MELDISSIMMGFFIILLILSIWKIYVFLPNKELEDDDSTQEAQENIKKVLLLVVKENRGDLTKTRLFLKMQEHKEFDTKKHWRFNENKLNQLLNYYYNENPQIKNIGDIYEKLT